jgi:hypothetical protein
MQKKFAVLERRLERSFEQRVEAETHKRFLEATKAYTQQTRDKLKEADEILRVWNTPHQRPLTLKQYNVIRNALHPDTPAGSKSRHDAFILFTEKEKVLRPIEEPRPLSGTLPETVEELQRGKHCSPSRAGSGGSIHAWCAVRPGGQDGFVGCVTSRTRLGPRNEFTPTEKGDYRAEGHPSTPRRLSSGP